MADDGQLTPGAVAGSLGDVAAGGVTPVTTTQPGTTQTKMVPETDLNRLRSTLDRQNAELRSQTEKLTQELQQFKLQADRARLENATPEEQLAYEMEQEQGRLEQDRQQLQQQQYAAANARYVYELANYYVQQGVPQSVLTNLADPSEMQDAAFKYLKSDDYIKSRQASSNPQQAAAAVLTPPPVTTNKPAAVGTLSWSKIDVGSAEEAQLFKDISAGRINPKDIAK